MGFFDFVFESFGTIFVVVLVIMGLIMAAGVVLAVRNISAAKRAGHDPFTMRTELASRLLESEALRGEERPEDRLAKLDELLAAGAISAEEHAAARSRVLGDL